MNRNQRVAASGVAAMLARVAQVGTSLFTVPLVLRYLDTERFGLWMTISSVLAMAAFADFGVGNGVLNTVAKAFGEDDFHGIRQAVSSGFAILCSIALCVLLAFSEVLITASPKFLPVSKERPACSGHNLAPAC